MWSFYDLLKTHQLNSIVVPFVDNTIHLLLFEIHCVSMINTMLHKTLTMQLINPYLAVNDVRQYSSCPVYKDIMKSLVSKEHHCSLSGGLYFIKGNNNCVLASSIECRFPAHMDVKNVSPPLALITILK